MAVSSPLEEQSERFVFRFFTVSAVLLCVSCSVADLSESVHGKARRSASDMNHDAAYCHREPTSDGCNADRSWCWQMMYYDCSCFNFLTLVRLLFSLTLSIIRRATGEYEADVDFV